MLKSVGNGEVFLIAGGERIYTDIAARFVRSERPVDEIIASDYDASIINNIISSGHLAATEFDYFIFGIQGYSRVCETQLVRKRLASYLIKSGRLELKGKRAFNLVAPRKVYEAISPVNIHGCMLDISGEDIASICEQWYNYQVSENKLQEEDLRYLKPQATEFRAIIGMNIHALLDWWKIRLCLNAQFEIRDLASKMFKLVKDVAPDLVQRAGPSCKVLGYCPEGKFQNNMCKGRIPTKEDIANLIEKHWR